MPEERGPDQLADNPFTDTPIETGITATVMTPAMLDAAKALVKLPDDLTPVALAQLAREIAYDVGKLSVILSKYKLTQVHYDFLCEHNEFFRNALHGQIKEWQAIKTTQERIKLQAAAALEEQMPVLAHRMGRQSEELRDVVEAAKFFARVAGVDNPDQRHGPAGERFTITIDLGGDKLTVGTAGSADDDSASPAPAEIRGHPERIFDLQALPMVSEIQGSTRQVQSLPQGQTKKPKIRKEPKETSGKPT